MSTSSGEIRVLSVIFGAMYGGPHNRNRRLSPLLAARGVRTIVLIPDEPGNAAERLRGYGVEVVALPLKRLRATRHVPTHLELLRHYFVDVGAIRKVIRDRGIDIVQVNGLSNTQAGVAARLEHVPVVWQILDTRPPMAMRRVLMPIVRRLSHCLMATGHAVAREHPGAVGPDQDLVTFFPPVDVHEFRPDPVVRAHVRSQLGFGNDDLVIGTVGNVNPQKGHKYFIRAAAQLRSMLPHARFVILGTQYDHFREYTDSLWTEATALGLRFGDDLRVVDPAKDVARLAQAIDIFWQTSEPLSEGIPTAVEEAMALGIPVVAADVGSTAEAVIDGITGRLVKPGDDTAFARTTFEMLANQKSLESMKTRSREVATASFAMEQCADRHKEAYELALRSRRRPHVYASRS